MTAMVSNAVNNVMNYGNAVFSAGRNFAMNPVVQRSLPLVAVGGLVAVALVKPELVKEYAFKAVIAAVAAVAFAVLSPVLGLVAAATVIGGVSNAVSGWSDRSFAVSKNECMPAFKDFVKGAIFGAAFGAAPQVLGLV